MKEDKRSLAGNRLPIIFMFARLIVQSIKCHGNSEPFTNPAPVALCSVVTDKERRREEERGGKDQENWGGHKKELHHFMNKVLTPVRVT